MPTADLPRDDFTRWMRELDRRIGLVEQRSAFANTGLSVPGPGVVQVDGNLNVVGSSTVSGLNGIASSNYVPGTTGWKFDGTSLEANTGVIGNGALANPIRQETQRASATAFGLATTFVTLASTTVTVPAGFTQAQFIAFARMYTVNPNTTGGSDTFGGDALYVRVNVGGSLSTATAVGISGSNGFTTATSYDVFTLPGLVPGSTFTMTAEGKSAYATIPVYAGALALAIAGVTWSR